jgi:hypothetical protein
VEIDMLSFLPCTVRSEILIPACIFSLFKDELVMGRRSRTVFAGMGRRMGRWFLGLWVLA